VRQFNYDLRRGHIKSQWFSGATTNMAYNCIDRHLETQADQPALIWEGHDPAQSRTVTYRDLHEKVCQCGNVLKTLGVKRGGAVTLYLPGILELPIAMLACARIGAVHNVVHCAFDAAKLANSLISSQSRILITASGTRSEEVPLLQTANEAIRLATDKGAKVETIVFEREGFTIDHHTDHLWADLLTNADTTCPTEPIDAEAPLFTLFMQNASGSAKSIAHSTGGYMVYAAFTHKTIFDHHNGDIFFCVADIGWITGHSYAVYGPLLNGGTTLITEIDPKHTPDRYWQLIDAHQVTQFYTSPSHIRRMIDTANPDDFDLSSLKTIGTVGEPILPEAWQWVHQHIGHECCPIVDTWWQTESGGILISSFPGATPTKPGAAGLPLFGVKPAILDPKTGQELQGNNVEGLLAIAEPWPGQMHTLHNHRDQFEETYFKPYPGYYFTGDHCRRDADGYYWILGRTPGQ
jgi:acetyl-CoA synthetase